ncbi:unnamed protein product [Effrenium voratum]|uniref:STI1 domain-containing protein n=1 Tax=Effrenium voratum TaxID=2562239 RepID=A0AA36IVH1_9DINO|nr:unnamed protein product [Effrenium voratum]CAJ1453179.1 unnamed protein product [Effrenium voratum]
MRLLSMPAFSTDSAAFCCSRTSTNNQQHEFDSDLPMALITLKVALLMWQAPWVLAGVSVDAQGRLGLGDVKAQEDLGFEGMDAWANIFKSVGRGEQADPGALTRLAGIEVPDTKDAKEELDPKLKEELGQQTVQDRIRSLTGKPEMLMKVLKENPMVQQLAKANPTMHQIIHSPEALQTLFSSEVLKKLRAGERLA